MDSTIKEISEHLEFLGYETSPSGDDGFHATHSVRPNFLARAFNGGCLLSAWYGTTAQAVVNREGFLEAINALNAQARIYVDKEFDLTVEAFYPVPYERTYFGRFMDMWDRDFSRVVDSDIDQYLT
jgi:hypothetical protein